MYVILMDTWNIEKSAKSVAIDKYENIATARKDGAAIMHQASGTHIIKKGMIGEWTFKLDGNRKKSDSTAKPMAILIGVVNYVCLNYKEKSYPNWWVNNGFSFYTYKAEIKHKGKEGIIGKSYGTKCYPGDVVKMILDMTQKENKNGILSYEINDESYGKAFDGIDVDQGYCMVVSILTSIPDEYVTIQIIE